MQSILISEGLLIVKVKIIWFYHEVAVDNFRGWAVTGINSVTSDFSASCCYFEKDMAINEKTDKYLKDIVAYGHA